MTISINGWQLKFRLLSDKKGSGAFQHRFLFI